MIRVSGLSKSFGAQQVLNGVSFQVAGSEVLAVMGPSGTGKSVLLLHLIGLLSPDQGEIEIDCARVDQLSEKKLLGFRRRMGYLFQDGALFDFMTVQENLAFPLREHTALGADAVHARTTDFLRMVDLAGAQDKYPSEISGGMRKRAALARALILEPKVLLCDEPTSGLDPVRSRDISLLIRDLAKRMGCATVITTHDAVNAFRCADRMIMLDRGKVVAQGSESDLRSSPEPFVRAFLEDCPAAGEKKGAMDAKG